MNTYYLNTDLELESDQDLTPIVEAFGQTVITLYNGEARGHYLTSFEIEGLLIDRPDFIIKQFCSLAEQLVGEEKFLWDTCISKVFDIGYQSGAGPASYTDEVCATTLQRVAALGASIRITVYPID